LDDPPVWGFSAAPLVDGDLIYTLAGGKGSAVVALDRKNGDEKWKALTTREVGYSAPMLVTAGGKRQMPVWLSESLNGLNPKTGKVYWTRESPIGREPTRPAVNIVTVVPHGDKLLLSTAYHGTMLLQLDKKKPGVKVLWRGKSNRMEKPDGLHSLMATPIL